MSTRYAILGTGGLGGFYGGLLARAGLDVHFLARSDAEHLKQHGLRVDSKFGDFVVPHVNAHAQVEAMPPCDVAIVAMKTTENKHLAALLPPILGDHGIAVVLQNGLCPECDAASVLGVNRVIGGCCFLCSQKVGPGHIQHLDYGKIALGEYYESNQPSPGVTQRLRDIGSDFSKSGIPLDLTPDLWRSRWTKLVWNVPFNGLSVVLQASTDRLMAHAEGLVRSLMDEVVEAAAACGQNLGSEIVEKMLENTRKMVPYDSSMALDYRYGRPMEIEAIYAALVSAARAQKTSVPRIQMLYQQLQYLETTR